MYNGSKSLSMSPYICIKACINATRNVESSIVVLNNGRHYMPHKCKDETKYSESWKSAKQRAEINKSGDEILRGIKMPGFCKRNDTRGDQLFDHQPVYTQNVRSFISIRITFATQFFVLVCMCVCVCGFLCVSFLFCLCCVRCIGRPLFVNAVFHI